MNDQVGQGLECYQLPELHIGSSSSTKANTIFEKVK